MKNLRSLLVQNQVLNHDVYTKILAETYLNPFLVEEHSQLPSPKWIFSHGMGSGAKIPLSLQNGLTLEGS